MSPESPASGHLASVRTALTGRCEILREIGRGGMATVYLAKDLKHDRNVAIKVLHPEISSGMGAERFLREIRIAAGLQHPNILPLHDSGRANGFLYYIMPFVEGEALDQVLKRETQLSVGDATRYASEIAEALAYAHSSGIIHRDIKPENILISNGHAIVMDFGIARAISEAGEESLTKSGVSIGTPSYMSPEQAGADPGVDHRSDIYSLACVLFEMLSGQPPFSGATAHAVMSRHLREKPPSVSTVRPTVPPSIVAAIDRALEKVPADRFSTALDFSRALTSEKNRPITWRRIQTPVVSVLVTAGIAAALLFGLRPWFWGGPDLDPDRVVAFPLVSTDPEMAEQGIGWNVALAIGTALEHAQPLRFIDGTDWLPQEAISNPGSVAPAEEKQITRDRRARYYTAGVVRYMPDSLSVVLRLFDVLGDTLVRQETATGSAEETNAEALGLVAVSKLLPHILATGEEVDFSPLTDRIPGAIALTIAGMRQYRHAQYQASYDLFVRALEADSLLAFAAAKGAQAASWLNEYDEASDLISKATAHLSLLPPKYQEFVQGWGRFLEGEADPAVEHLREALELDPNWAEALMALGEVYYHLLPSEAPLDSLAAVTFEETLEHDSILGPAMFHLTEIALRRGNLGLAESLIRKQTANEADSSWTRQLELMRESMQSDPGAFNWQEAAEASYAEVLRAARSLTVGGYQVERAVGGLKAVLGLPEASRSHWATFMTLQSAFLAQGRTQEALTLLDSAQAAGSSGVFSLFIYDAIAGWPTDEKAEEAREAARRVTEPGYLEASPANRWLLGLWAAHSDRPEEVKEILDGFLADPDARASPTGQLAVASLSARLDLMAGDTAGAIERLQGLRSRTPPNRLVWDLVGHLAAERALLAELLLESGQYEQAWQAASVFDHPASVLFLLFLPRSLEIRLEAAEALGRGRAAEQLRSRRRSLLRSEDVP